MESGTDYDMKIGDSAKHFTLPATDGCDYSLDDFRKKVLVVFFTCNHCPYAVAYESRIMALAENFAEHADFAGICSNDPVDYPQDSFDRMKEHAEERGFNFVYLHDSSQETAKAYGARCTPHFFVFDRDRKLQYQGSLDNNWESPENASEEYLKDAVQSLIDGDEVLKKLTAAVGCSIKWK